MSDVYMMGRGEGEGTVERSEDGKNGKNGKKPGWWDVEPLQLLGRHIGPVLVLTNERFMQLPDDDDNDDDADGRPPLPPVPARARTGFRDVVWAPPDVSLRRVVG